MLARPHRLTGGRDFAETIRRGRRAGTSTVVLHLAAGPGQDGPAPRVGLVVGRSVGNAVTRNQVKRRLRHVVAERLDRLPGGARLVVRALPPAASGSSQGLGQDIDYSLRRLGIRG